MELCNARKSWFESVKSAILTVHLVDLWVGGQDLVGEFLRRGQHFGVVRRDQILHQFLQLVPVHLEERLGDREPQLHLLGPPDAVQRQGHHMGAVKDIAVPAAACHWRDLAAVKADGHAVRHLRFRVRGRFCYCSTKVETWKETEGDKNVSLANHIRIGSKSLMDVLKYTVAVYAANLADGCKSMQCMLCKKFLSHNVTIKLKVTVVRIKEAVCKFLQPFQELVSGP